MKINYDEQALFYEKTREVEPIVYFALSYMLMPVKGDIILDFGCGTGNYLKKLYNDYEIEPYGIEPSFNMRNIAQKKLRTQNIVNGNHENIPFSDIQFNKIYSTDVIHHIDHLDLFFMNLRYVAATKAKLCICTESSEQLLEKYWIKYFPSIPKIDLLRFHPIEKVIKIGESTGWIHQETLKTEDKLIAPISTRFIERVRHKTLSIFNLISDEEYNKGISRMEEDYHNQVIFKQYEGYTFILFEKEHYDGF